jgi:chemotaxis methyl-accepting protein methylase
VKTIPFCATNENLEAIIAGLLLEPTDRVLAVCGSGDQPVSIAEYAGEVTAVDIMPSQVDYARLRVQALAVGETSFFLGPCGSNCVDGTAVELRNSYFEEEGRLRRLSRVYEKIGFEVGDVFTRPYIEQDHDKVYLSTVIDYLCLDYDQSKQCLELLGHPLRAGGLVYVVSMQDAPLEYIPDCLMIREDLTTKARKLEQTWYPYVLERKK